MNDVTLPVWLEVVRAVGSGFGPFLLFGSALVAALIAWRAYRQRKEADDREELWRRTQWAIDYASHEDEGRAGIGLEALNRLAVSPLAAGEDRELVRAMLGEVIAARAHRAYNGSTAHAAQDQRPERRFRRPRRGG